MAATSKISKIQGFSVIYSLKSLFSRSKTSSAEIQKVDLMVDDPSAYQIEEHSKLAKDKSQADAYLRNFTHKFY
ncbi:MAG: hypothetical protein ACXAE3_15560 [Candidatus Kariarchaeaceae archaeon]|jgi:hypothetical protein